MSQERVQPQNRALLSMMSMGYLGISKSVVVAVDDDEHHFSALLPLHSLSTAKFTQTRPCGKLQDPCRLYLEMSGFLSESKTQL